MPSFLASLVLVVAIPITAAAQTTQSLSEQPQPGGTITGIVTNNEGDPIEGATLCTNFATANGSGTSCGGTETGKDGKFELHVPLGEIGVFAEKRQGGYWPPAVENSYPRRHRAAGIKTVTLTADAPTATVTLKIGPKPSDLKFNVKDKSTGKPIEGFRVRWIAMDDARMMSIDIPTTQTLIPPGIDVIVAIQAQGYRRSFYVDPSTSQPIIRLASGEERQLDVELEPEEKK